MPEERAETDTIYREMLSVALEQATEAARRFARLAEQHEALKVELRRYVSAQVTDDAGTSRLPD